MPRPPSTHRAYHGYMLAGCDSHGGHSMHVWSYDDTCWLMLTIIKSWHDERGLRCKVFRWRGAAPPVPDPSPGDMQLEDMPW
jgi:hypothetical protein